MVGHGRFDGVNRNVGLDGKGPRLKDGIDEVSIPVDEPPPEGGVVQDVVEQLTVYAGKSGVARRFDVIVVNASAKEAKPCIGVVEQVGPAAFGRGAEDLGVVQAPSDAHPIHVLDVRLKNEVIDVIIDVK